MFCHVMENIADYSVRFYTFSNNNPCQNILNGMSGSTANFMNAIGTSNVNA